MVASSHAFGSASVSYTVSHVTTKTKSQAKIQEISLCATRTTPPTRGDARGTRCAIYRSATACRRIRAERRREIKPSPSAPPTTSTPHPRDTYATHSTNSLPTSHMHQLAPYIAIHSLCISYEPFALLGTGTGTGLSRTRTPYRFQSQSSHTAHLHTFASRRASPREARRRSTRPMATADKAVARLATARRPPNRSAPRLPIPPTRARAPLHAARAAQHCRPSARAPTAPRAAPSAEEDLEALRLVV